MIDLSINEKLLMNTKTRARELDITIPTFAQMMNPELIPGNIISELKETGLWDVDPINLFRISWRNERSSTGGLFGDVNYIEFPPELTGVDSRIIALSGKWFPTGSHKVGATFGCLVPKLITGQFDPTLQKAVWPSTGNFCRGGAYVSSLLSCESIAILPEEMSKERFEWLRNIAGEVIVTPGGESNVKEIYDKCKELKNTRDNIRIFNQFEEFGNYIWHYHVTGSAIKEVFEQKFQNDHRFSGFVSSSGSAGTLAAGDHLKNKYPGMKIAAAEALQCPTMLLNGFGAHRIEGIGDKHIPWIHNVRNTDLVIAVDDNPCMELIRLFNEPEGRRYLIEQGCTDKFIKNIDLIGISGMANLIASIKFSKYYELTEKDVVFTVLTDSMELYSSRIDELSTEHGEYKRDNAIKDYHKDLMGIAVDNMLELNHNDRKRIHNLKYFTWIEQQGKDVEDLNDQWYNYPEYWNDIVSKKDEIDKLINEFNTK
ncbi:MAG: pyridoxal-phosphate dependent enzyme [bacterium]|nr:pyridoxal-phosphate dependent enzyme [bacterium]